MGYNKYRKLQKGFNNMIIKFFEKDGHINADSIYAGVYLFKIGLINEEEKNYLTLYIGESYSMLSRCSNHLYELFHNDPSYFGLSEENLKDNELQLIVDIYEKVPLEDNISNSDRDILLREKEIAAIKKLSPLS